MKKIVLATGLLLTALPAFAEQSSEVTATPLKTHTEMGYIQTSGNTNTKTFNLDATAQKSWGKHEGKINFDGQYASDSGVETKNKYIVELNYFYAFTPALSFDYLVGYKSDKFSSYTYQFYTGPGAQYKAINNDIHKLFVSGNFLYSQDQYADIHYADTAKTIVIPYPNPDNTPVVAVDKGRKESYAAYRLKAVYDYQITKTLKFNQELSLRGQFNDMQNYFGYSKTMLSSKISDIFSAGVSYKIDYVNRPSDDKKKTDTTFTFNLIMDY